jgi:hypothetical protein
MVNACTRKVTTKTAMTIVPATDCTVAGQSPADIFSPHDIRRLLAILSSRGAAKTDVLSFE